MSEIIIRPIITEKMTAQGESMNRFGFEVARSANKVEIKKEIEKMYGVSVVAVRTMNYGGKVKSRNTKTAIIPGRTNAVKKAVVQVAEGDTIDFYSNI